MKVKKQHGTHLEGVLVAAAEHLVAVVDGRLQEQLSQALMVQEQGRTKLADTAHEQTGQAPRVQVQAEQTLPAKAGRLR